MDSGLYTNHRWSTKCSALQSLHSACNNVIVDFTLIKDGRLSVVDFSRCTLPITM